MKFRIYVAAFGLFLISGTSAEAVVPTIDMPGTMQAATEVTNTISGYMETATQVMQYQQTMGAMGLASMGAAWFMANNQGIITEQLKKVEEYKKKIEEYKETVEAYKAEVESTIDTAKGMATSLKDQAMAMKDTAMGMVDAAKATVSSVGEAVGISPETEESSNISEDNASEDTNASESTSSTSSDIVDAPILTPSRRKIGSRETRDVVTGGSGEGSTGSISTGGSSSGGSVLPSRSSGFSGGISQGISSGISGGNSGISSAIAQDKAEDSTSSTSAKEKLSQTVDSSSSAKRNVSGNKEIASQDNTAKADTDTPSIDTRVEQATVGSSSNETSKEKIKVSTRNERSRASSNGSSEDQVNSGVSGVVGKSAGITIGSGNTSSTSNSSEEGQVYSNTSSQVFSLKTEGASRGTQSSKTSHVITVNGEKINILLDEEGNVYYDKIVSADIIKAARDYTSTIKGKLKAREDQKIKYKDVFVEKAKELTVITDIEGKIKADIEEEKMNNLQKQFFLNCQEAAKKEDESSKIQLPSRAAFKTSFGYGHAHVSYPLAFASALGAAGGETADGVFIFSKSVGLYCDKMTYEQAAEKGVYDNCLKDINTVRGSEITEEVTKKQIDTATNDAYNGYAETLAAGYFEAMEIYNETLTFKNDSIIPVTTSEVSTIEAAWPHVTEIDRILGDPINALSKLYARDLLINNLNLYVNESFEHKQE